MIRRDVAIGLVVLVLLAVAVVLFGDIPLDLDKLSRLPGWE